MNKFTIILGLLLFVIAINVTTAESCYQTSECRQGYCENSECIIPTGNVISLGTCEITKDCIQGYCDQGQCLIPMGDENSLSLGFKSGCMGLISCPESSLTCLIFCNLLWVILFVMSILAAYLARHWDNKAYMIAFLLIPILVALVSIVAAGIIVAIIEIIIVKYKKNELQEKEAEEIKEDEMEALDYHDFLGDKDSPEF